jgi:hypothetical protein
MEHGSPARRSGSVGTATGTTCPARATIRQPGDGRPNCLPAPLTATTTSNPMASRPGPQDAPASEDRKRRGSKSVLTHAAHLVTWSRTCDTCGKVAEHLLCAARDEGRTTYYRFQRHVIVIRTVSHACFRGCRCCGGSLASQYGCLLLHGHLRANSPGSPASSRPAATGRRTGGASPSSASAVAQQTESPMI